MGSRIAVPDFGRPLRQTMADYLRTDAWHKGDAKTATEDGGPRRLIELRNRPEDLEDDDGTRATTFGTAAHCAVWEPECFAERFEALPPGDGRRAEVRNAKADIERRGKGALRPAEYEGCLRVRKILEEHPLVGPSLFDTDGESEVSIFTKHAATGLPLAIRPDRLLERRGLVLDLKTTKDADPKSFARTMAAYAYDVGAAWYPDRLEEAGLSDCVMVYIAVESSFPYLPRVYLPGPRTIARGRTIAERGLRIIAECLESKVWPAFGQGVEEIEVAEHLLEQEGA